MKRGNEIFRTGKIFRQSLDKKTGDLISKEPAKENDAKVMYPIEDVEDTRKEKE